MSENLLKILLQKSLEKAQLSNKNKLHFRSRCCPFGKKQHITIHFVEKWNQYILE